MVKFQRALIFAAAAICTLAPAADARQPVRVSCGDVITRDTRLANDIEDCRGSGLVIGAPGITLDLDDHTIDGDEVPAGDGETEAGIDNSAGHDDVTVEDGTIRGFDIGVSLPEVSRNRLSELRVVRNAILGMDLDLSDHSVIEDSSFSRNGADFEGPGIFLVGSHHNLISDNRVAGNGGAGLFQLDSNDNRIAENAFVANADGLILEESEDNRVTRNLVARNTFAGIGIAADQTTVSRNRAIANGDNMFVFGNGNKIARNDLTDAVGCPDGCGYGISFEGGRDNLIVDNTVAGSREAGIRLGGFPPDNPEAIQNTVSRNVVLGAGVDGILVEPSATDTLLEGNLARGAGDDGIDVDSPETTLTRNTARRNRDLGIEAVPGVTDGGGNRARRNGNPAQCTGVDCGR
jgi:parallel beta-helix repeat protein